MDGGSPESRDPLLPGARHHEQATQGHRRPQRAAPDKPDPQGSRDASLRHQNFIELTKFIRLESTGTFGTGSSAVSRKVTYYTPIGYAKAAARAEEEASRQYEQPDELAGERSHRPHRHLYGRDELRLDHEGRHHPGRKHAPRGELPEVQGVPGRNQLVRCAPSTGESFTPPCSRNGSVPAITWATTWR